VRGGRVVVGARPFGHGRDRNRKRRCRRRRRRRRGPDGSHAHIRRPSVRPSDVRRLFKFNRYNIIIMTLFPPRPRRVACARCRFEKKNNVHRPTRPLKSERCRRKDIKTVFSFTRLVRVHRIILYYYYYYYDIPLLSAENGDRR